MYVTDSGKDDVEMKYRVVTAAAVLIAAAVCAGALTPVLYGRAQVKKLQAQPLSLPAGFLVTAHTGCLGTKENTLDSLHAALGSGANAVEFDIRFRKDGTPVLAHDALQDHDKSPLLADAFALIAQTEAVQVNLDLKQTDNLPEIARLGEEAGILDRLFFTGVGAGEADKVARECPEIPYYLNVSPDTKQKKSDAYWRQVADRIRLCGAVGINCHYDAASESLVRVMHEQGLLVSFWTVNRKTAMARIASLGPDNITTKEPVKLRELLAGWKSL